MAEECNISKYNVDIILSFMNFRIILEQASWTMTTPIIIGN